MTDTITGILKSVDNMHFAVRTSDRLFHTGPGEIMVPPDLARRFGLIEGALVTGQVERNKSAARLSIHRNHRRR